VPGVLKYGAKNIAITRLGTEKKLAGGEILG
jgi:hypothetical protein